MILIVQAAPIRGSVPPWSYNFPGSPFVITTIGTKAFDVKNVSAKVITTYQLGCVAVGESDSQRITLRMPIVSAQIKAEESVERLSFHNLEEKALCAQKKSKLTVLFVRWADGEWNAIPGENHRDNDR